MYTFQDFEKAEDKTKFILDAINQHKYSELYTTAETANLYDRQRNKTINEFIRIVYKTDGSSAENYAVANYRLANNLFHRLNTQRCTYSLGNGVSFSDHKKEVVQENGLTITIDETKERLGSRFDTDFKKLAYKAIIHGVSFGYWNTERLYVFPVTEFVPLWDENTSVLRAGIRFWRIDNNKPLNITLYEKDGYTKYRVNSELKIEETQEKRSYVTKIRSTNADGEVVTGENNYTDLPIIPLWGSDLKQSTLTGMQQALDSIDLIKSGFANDLSDCAEIYWLIENYGGMTDADLEQFRDRLKFLHIASVNTQDGGKITTQTQNIPYAARQTYLAEIRASLYEDFGGLDVHTVAAGATNDHIDAAYQPLDENADDFEYQCIEFIQQLLNLEGISDTPIFKRNRISNQTEQTQMVVSVSEHLDEETILQKLPFITVDEIPGILARKDKENMDRMLDMETIATV